MSFQESEATVSETGTLARNDSSAPAAPVLPLPARPRLWPGERRPAFKHHVQHENRVGFGLN